MYWATPPVNWRISCLFAGIDGAAGVLFPGAAGISLLVGLPGSQSYLQPGYDTPRFQLDAFADVSAIGLFTRTNLAHLPASVVADEKDVKVVKRYPLENPGVPRRNVHCGSRSAANMAWQ